ncbi:hypothetical protein [Spirosoma panaciterrae]|uniref:hypothetical protein n=1 Tax=Spirosoma panaciterrae TaxID=496058 RepID=UPI00035EE622|nr:hypothetical protein [Spirosoma panaciterrae]
MKTIRLSAGIVLLPLTLLTGHVASATDGTSAAKITSVVLVQDNPVLAHLDNAVASLTKGDKSATTQELQAGITGLESQAQTQPTSFKDKLLAQASKLKALLPLIPTGALGNGVLSKAVSLAKLASGGSQLEGILAAGSLLGKGSQLTSGLSGIGGALSALGGSTQSSGQSLVSTALATVGKLDQGGLVAKAAEPAAKTQVNSVLNFVKGVL